MKLQSAEITIGVFVNTVHRIHPSSMHGGVAEGLVKVIDIMDADDNNRVREYANDQMSMLDFDLRDCEDTEIALHYNSCNYVEYEYVSVDDSERELLGQSYYMTLECFLAHVTAF